MEEKVVIQQRPPKSPAAAGILSIIFPGTGALYNGQIAKGIFYMILFAGLITIQAHSGFKTGSARSRSEASSAPTWRSP
jgi:hypothetical protein